MENTKEVLKLSICQLIMAQHEKKTLDPLFLW